MAYKDFTFQKLEKDFGIKQSRRVLFNGGIKPVKASDWLLQTLNLAAQMPLKSEKAKSELIIAPILTEIRQLNKDRIEMFSGEVLTADSKLKLKGEVDFILVQYPQSVALRDPIFSVTEAKRGALDEGWHQCAAQMYGARVFNAKNNNPISDIYGAVSNGVDWQFLLLEANTVFVDEKTYTIENLEQLLGILQTVVDFYN
jgi:hypothetical protein